VRGGGGGPVKGERRDGPRGAGAGPRVGAVHRAGCGPPQGTRGPGSGRVMTTAAPASSAPVSQLVPVVPAPTGPQAGTFATLDIGPHRVWPPVVLAPMAGVTNAPFRTLCREYGAGLYVSEMIMTRAIVERIPKTMAMIGFAPD